MNRAIKLEEKVRALYKDRYPNRADWADWLLNNHVLIVADYATELSEKYGAGKELSRVAALLHDIADTQTKRADLNHEKLSLQIARKLMLEAGYTQMEIKIVVDDAIQYHSCYGNRLPKSAEGKVLATADAIAHLKTDFYNYAVVALRKEMTREEVKKWALKKLDHDLKNKIFFDDIREEVRPDYKRIKKLINEI